MGGIRVSSYKRHLHFPTWAKSLFFNAHDLDWLIFPIINYISEECEAVSFGPSLLYLRSRGVEQWGIIG